MKHLSGGFPIALNWLLAGPMFSNMGLLIVRTSGTTSSTSRCLKANAGEPRGHCRRLFTSAVNVTDDTWAASYSLQMPSPAKPPPFPVRLECISWQLVQHHLLHGALRFEDDVLKHLRQLPPSDGESHVCIATQPDDLIEVLGVIHYRLTDADLFFEYIRVREAYRCRDIGRKMITEVVTHPACISLPRIHMVWIAEGGNALVRHLEWLRDNVPRLCGTPFELDASPVPGR